MVSPSVESNCRRVGGELAFRIGLSVAGLVIGLAVVEIGLRLFVPVCEMPFVRYLDDYQILSYDPTLKTEGIYTAGPRSQVRGRWRINNAGWNSSIDYVPSKILPRIAIVGDSYVEAFQVDVEDSFPELLRERLKGQYEVYQFGMSGATLPGYLRMSRYVARNFDPEVIVVVVSHNDFIGSLASGMVASVRSKIKIDGGRAVEVAPAAYRPNPIRRLLSRSALIRFCVLNRRFERQWKPSSPRSRWDGGAPTTEAERWEQVDRMLEYVLSRMVQENPNRRIVVVHDGDRRAIYQGEGSSIDRVHWGESIKTLAKKLSFKYLDLHGPMESWFESNGRTFNSMHDYHWNETGHAFVAEQLVNQLLHSEAPSVIP